MKTVYEELSRLVNMKGSSTFIDADTAEQQKKTAATIAATLDQRPGIILGDEVGMGKTYMAIAVIYHFLDRYPHKPVLVVAPSWMMADKWVGDIRTFIEVNAKKDILQESDILHLEKRSSAQNLKIFVEEVHQKKVIVVPVDVFTSGGWKKEKSFFLNCWFRHRGLRNDTRYRIMNELVGDPYLTASPVKDSSMWTKYHHVPPDCYEELDKAYNTRDMSAERVSSAIEHLRYRAMNERLPMFSLFVLDEAHRIKNPDTKRHQALHNMLKGRYEKALFLTATPFQLSTRELYTVLNLFTDTAGDQGDKSQFDHEVQQFKQAVQAFIACTHDFEQAWKALRPDEADLLTKMIQACPPYDISPGDIEYALNRYELAKDKRDELQSIMRKFVIRNVKDKQRYRREIIGKMDGEQRGGIELGDEHYIPFALWEKTIYELFRKQERTFIPTVKQSMTSSYEAFRASSLYQRDQLNALTTLKQVMNHEAKHPKLEELAASVDGSIRRNEKTLIFCNRLETAEVLKERLSGRLDQQLEKDMEELFPENSAVGFKNFQKRFYNKEDSAWYYLQENYVQSVLEVVMAGQPSGITAESVLDEVRNKYRRYNRTDKTNLMFLKRIVEQTVIKEALSRHKVNLKTLPANLKATVESILTDDFIEWGLDRSPDDYERQDGEETELRIRNISIEMIERIMNYDGIWTQYRDLLNQLPPGDRDNVVDALIYFMRRDKTFFITLKRLEVDNPDKKRYQLIPEAFAQGAEFNWRDATQRYLEQFVDAATPQREAMLSGLKESLVVDIISGDVQYESRERIKDGFNTPFYPLVLICLPLAQEGIDLQRECRRVIHYDLEWNPASLEQRVGRIDRINSLISRLNPDGEADVKLEIYYPYLKDTIDQAILRTVKTRERWFSFILGGAPDWETFSLDEETRPLPPEICKTLQIDLSVG